MHDDFIDYGQLIDDAMHVIVQRALQLVESEGLKGNHHFFISFITNYPGVLLSEKLQEKYPDEMTIVLQYQYEELIVDDEGFTVTLSFDGARERIGVPFDALTAFADPSVKFGLQFRHVDEEGFEDDESLIAEVKEFVSPDPSSAMNSEEEVDKQSKKTTAKKSTAKSTKGNKATASKKSSAKKKEEAEDPTNVVDLDNFRKK